MSAITAPNVYSISRGAKTTPAIEVDGLKVDLFGLNILSNMDFSIKAGEIVSIVGPSGSGKTTLLRTLAGLVKPTAGTVRVDGVQVQGPMRDLSVVFQDYGKALLPWRTVAGNVALAFEATKIARAEQVSRISMLLELVGLGKHAAKYPRQLSGGMQQRLQIARCLAQNPRVLLMDEPFGALDAMTRQSLQDEILAIAAKTDKTIIFITHDLEEAIYISDRVLGLLPRPGRIGEIFDVKLSRPRDRITTLEDPEFVSLRRKLFDFIHSAEEVH